MAQHGKLLVSGATGTVGGQVVKRLAEAGADVRAYSSCGPFMTSAGADDVLGVIKRHARRVVCLSAYGVRPETERQISSIHRFHAELERAVQRSGLDWVFLHPVSFASNNLSWAPYPHSARHSTG
jgi:uncharacterized protein YbjT (DUF2867 family)